MGRLEVKKSVSSTKIVYALKGQIDEDTKFEAHSISDVKNLEIDLNDVTHINSCGIREWIKWLSTASSADQIIFTNCPKVVVDQINMVDGFLPKNAKVFSFYVPYYSEESGDDRNVLLTSGKEFTGSEVNNPPIIKDDKGNEMEMDVIPA